MPEQIKQEYIPPTYGALFMDTYLKTHRQRMQTALALAQQELTTQQSLLAYYAKKEKEYLEFIEGVGTAGSSGGSRKGLTDKKFDRQLALAKFKQGIQENKQNRTLSVEKLVNQEFGVPVGANLNATARNAALNLSASMANTISAIRGLTGFDSGSNEARVVGVALYNKMEAEAQAAGNGAIFNSNKSAIRKAIADTVGVPEVEQDILAPKRIEAAKAARKSDLMASIAGGTISNKELKELERLAGVAPTQTTGTTGAKGPSATSLEQEELMASRLAGIQSKMTNLEDSILEKSTAEAMLRRQKEIYRDQYGKKKGSSGATRKAMRNLTTEQRFLFDAIKSTQGMGFNPYNYVPAADGSDSATVKYKANELMNAIIANRGTGKPIDVAGMAAKMDPKNAEQIAGLALKGVVAYAKEADPLSDTKEIVDAETTENALESAIDDKSAQIEVQEKELADAEKKANAPIDEGFESMTQLRNDPAFPGGQADVDAFLANRTGVPTERIQEILGDRVTEAQAKRITEITTPPAFYGGEPQTVAVESAPKPFEIPEGTIFTYKTTGKMGYKFLGYNDDGTRRYAFVNKKGIVKPDVALNANMYADAEKMFEDFGKQEQK